MNNPDFIVIEGPIGVGKTTLAKKLADSFGSETLLEGADENPFMTKFYENPKAVALSAQLFFCYNAPNKCRTCVREICLTRYV